MVREADLRAGLPASPRWRHARFDLTWFDGTLPAPHGIRSLAVHGTGKHELLHVAETRIRDWEVEHPGGEVEGWLLLMSEEGYRTDDFGRLSNLPFLMTAAEDAQHGKLERVSIEVFDKSTE
jgi:hypothetical protein